MGVGTMNSSAMTGNTAFGGARVQSPLSGFNKTGVGAFGSPAAATNKGFSVTGLGGSTSPFNTATTSGVTSMGGFGTQQQQTASLGSGFSTTMQGPSSTTLV